MFGKINGTFDGGFATLRACAPWHYHQRTDGELEIANPRSGDIHVAES